MTAHAPVNLDDLPEVPVHIQDSIEGWRRVVSSATERNASEIFRNAAADLMRTRKISKTVHPNHYAVIGQTIVDALSQMAQWVELDDDAAQSIYAEVEHVSDSAPPQQTNGHHVEMEATAAPGTALVPFPLQAFENISIDTGRRGYLVKGLLASTGLAVIWGPPKCGKSFWAADLGLHIALGWDYRGHKVQQATVVYVALEGRNGFPARIEAFRQHHNVTEAPFYLLTTSLDLVAKASQLIAAVKAQLGDKLPGVLFLDTLNRSLVGSESKDEDMAKYLAAAEKVAQELKCVVVIVHHCGIDASRPRGHTSLSGAVESQLAVRRGGTGEVIVTVELAKDFAEGTEIFSQLEQVDVGTDPDGDRITSLIVLPAEQGASRPPARKLSDRQRLALAALDECVLANGEPAPASLQLPAGTVVAKMEEWRDELFNRGVLERDAKNPRQDFKRLRDALQARLLIGVNADLVWKA